MLALHTFAVKAIFLPEEEDRLCDGVITNKDAVAPEAVINLVP